MHHFTIGALALPGSTHISLGPRHPSQAGFISGTHELAGGLWRNIDIRIGYGHRAAEKLFEVRDYRTAIMLADRHDWLSAFTGELGVTLAVEQAMRLTPPPRVPWLRTVMAETARLHSHLGFLSHLSDDVWEPIERIRHALLAWSGNRVHPMLNRVGGLAADLPAGWALPLDDVRRVADRLEAGLSRTSRFRGLAVLDVDVCTGFGLSGPVARAAGLDLDRRASGYLVYADVFRPAPTRAEGDAHARFSVLVDELRTSADMLDVLLARAAAEPGEIAVRLARRLQVPEGEHWAELEAPWGIAGTLLVSRGGSTPWRLALRTPSFANLSALGHALEGTPETAIADAVASIGYSVGDADK
ncbi:MAG: NADH-quinone oxidoreductase subunit D [Propionibacterium sp.]|nr:NADH-quinone oxidoreductase subunit D [Propionibacterium sp.]